jgi:hypothetical protein
MVIAVHSLPDHGIKTPAEMRFLNVKGMRRELNNKLINSKVRRMSSSEM